MSCPLPITTPRLLQENKQYLLYSITLINRLNALI